MENICAIEFLVYTLFLFLGGMQGDFQTRQINHFDYNI